VDPHVIAFRSHRPKTRFDVAKAFAIGQLREAHDAIVVGALELLDFVIAAVAIHALVKMMPGQMLHELREYRRACVHPGLPLGFEGRMLR
tara:strand:- start:147 stop:416 length:270 start_codon:yes stop_codon:yes gene_type:complete